MHTPRNRSAKAAFGVALIAGTAAGGYLLSRRARAAEGPPTSARTIEMTVYSQDFALVQETRPVSLTAGANRIAFPDVSRSLDPNSVLLRWANGEPAELVGHAYDLGARDSQSVLHELEGRDVELVRYGDNGQESGREPGRLMLAEGGRPAIFEKRTGKLLVNPRAEVELSGRAETPLLPQLTVQAQAAKAGGGSLQVAYLTRGMGWHADYVATLSGQADDRMDLDCYATVTNETGIPFPNAAVTLVAGSPNRAAVAAGGYSKNPFTPNADLYQTRNAIPQPELAHSAEIEAPKSVAELEQFPLKNPATLQNGQMNRLLMFGRSGAKVKKDYAYRAPVLEPFSSPQQPRGFVTVGISFKNTAAEAFGKALPAGTVRVYDPDAGGHLRYAGADSVLDTPTNEKVHLTLGNAFDLTAAYRTVATRKISKRRVQKAVEITLRNARNTAVTVRVVQGFSGRWNVAKSASRFSRLDAGTAQWSIAVPKGGETRLAYTVELGS